MSRKPDGPVFRNSLGWGIVRAGPPQHAAHIVVQVAPIVEDEDVEAAIVVEVEESAGEAGDGLAHPQLAGDVRECPVTVVPIEPVLAAEVRDVQVGVMSPS